MVRENIVQFITSYISNHGYSPSFREIKDGVGLKSMSSVHAHMTKLFAEGKLETDAEMGSSRTIHVPGYKFVKEKEACQE